MTTPQEIDLQELNEFFNEIYLALPSQFMIGTNTVKNKNGKI